MSRSNPKLFKRRLFGYHRKAVNEHLASVDASIAELEARVDEAASPEHQDLVLRATRLSVESVLEQAETDAEAIRQAARAEAEAMLADAFDLTRARKDVIDLTADEEAIFDARPSAERASAD